MHHPSHKTPVFTAHCLGYASGLRSSRNMDVQRAAVLFVDVCGSTAYFDRHGELAGRDMVKRFFAIVHEAVEQHGGKVVNLIGDAVLAVFADPFALVNAATGAQVAIGIVGEAAESRERLRIHCGGHVGGIVFDDSGTVFGDAVNVAARVEELAGPDQIYVTEELLRQLASEGLPISRRVGAFKLSGKRRKVDVWEILWKDEDNMTDLVPTREHREETSVQLVFRNRTIVLSQTKERLSMGRERDNDLVVEDRAVSRIHAEVIQRTGGYYLVDRSTNGTYIRPRHGRDHRLHRDELLLVGEGEFSLGRADGPPVTYKAI
jgi:adenylate cyclase